jgi:hypothetical protein
MKQGAFFCSIRLKSRLSQQLTQFRGKSKYLQCFSGDEKQTFYQSTLLGWRAYWRQFTKKREKMQNKMICKQYAKSVKEDVYVQFAFFLLLCWESGAAEIY